MISEEIPQEIAKALTEEDTHENARRLIERLRREAPESTRRPKTKCPICGDATILIEGKIENCIKCGNKLTQLAISKNQKDPRRSQSLITDPVTKEQKKVYEIPKILFESAVVPSKLAEFVLTTIEKVRRQRTFAKEKSIRITAPADTQTKIITDLKQACEAWSDHFGIYVGSDTVVSRTEYLNNSFTSKGFANGKYKMILEAVKDLMDTLMELGAVPEEYFVNYEKYYDMAIKSDDEMGIIYANRVVGYASYFVQSPKSTVVIKRVENAIK